MDDLFIGILDKVNPETQHMVLMVLVIYMILQYCNPSKPLPPKSGRNQP